VERRALPAGNGIGASQSIAAPEANLPVNRWIIGEVVETLGRLDKAFTELRFDDMADAIYHFTWGTFCDWYVELVKGAFDDETRAVAAWAFRPDSWSCSIPSCRSSPKSCGTAWASGHTS
jgi:valyl-tRNA synthetase